MAKKAKRKGKVTLGDNSAEYEFNPFSNGRVDYSGFGYHNDKRKSNERRQRKLESKRARQGDYD